MMRCSILDLFVVVVMMPLCCHAGGLSVQPCNFGDDSFAPLVWTYSYSTHVFTQGSGLCLGLDASSTPETQACAAGAEGQQWSIHTDGTVESDSLRGQCLNVDGGQVDVGTPIILYPCGSLRSSSSSSSSSHPSLGVAQNDVFAYLPAPTSRIYANESGLCVASAAPPPSPPGPCKSNLDCSLNGQCNAGVCDCVCV